MSVGPVGAGPAIRTRPRACGADGAMVQASSSARPRAGQEASTSPSSVGADDLQRERMKGVRYGALSLSLFLGASRWTVRGIRNVTGADCFENTVLLPTAARQAPSGELPTADGRTATDPT